MPRCADCGHPLTAYCAACRGRKGGQSTSPAKVRASKRNQKKRWRNDR